MNDTTNSKATKVSEARSIPRFGWHLVGALALSTLIVSGCTQGGDQQAVNIDPDTTQAEGTTESTDTVPATGIGEEPDSRPVPVDSGDANSETRELVFADEDGLGEDTVDGPALGDDDVVEVDLELTPEVPQADVAVSEAALCATVQIGRDAVVDGNTTVEAEQRALLVERGNRVSDQALSNILAEVSGDEPLSGDVMENALARCEELGFER